MPSASEGYALDERALPGWDLDCVTNLRGCKTCPEALLMQPIETASLVWVSALGAWRLRCAAAMGRWTPARNVMTAT